MCSSIGQFKVQDIVGVVSNETIELFWSKPVPGVQIMGQRRTPVPQRLEQAILEDEFWPSFLNLQPWMANTV